MGKAAFRYRCPKNELKCRMVRGTAFLSFITTQSTQPDSYILGPLPVLRREL